MQKLGLREFQQDGKELDFLALREVGRMQYAGECTLHNNARHLPNEPMYKPKLRYKQEKTGLDTRVEVKGRLSKRGT